MRKWKWISGLSTLLVGAFVYDYVKKSSQGKIIFNPNISFKQNQSIQEESKDLPQITISDVVDMDKSRVDEVSFQMLPCENGPIQDRMFRNIFTGKPGEYEGQVFAKYNGECFSAPFKYTVY